MSLEMLFAVGVLVTRALLVLAGVLFCFLGYRLFHLVQPAPGNAEVSLSEHLKLNLSKVGPGVFFALFGAAILIQALLHPPKLDGVSYVSATGDTGNRILIAGQREVAPEIRSALSVEELRRHLRFMNGIPGLLRDNLSIEQRVTFENNLREAKLVVVSDAWDKRWGDFSHFASWARGHSAEAPNGEVRTLWEAK